MPQMRRWRQREEITSSRSDEQMREHPGVAPINYLAESAGTDSGAGSGFSGRKRMSSWYLAATSIVNSGGIRWFGPALTIPEASTRPVAGRPTPECPREARRLKYSLVERGGNDP